MRNITLTLTSVFALLCGMQAHAGYYTVLDNGEVLKEGHYKLIGDAQILTKDGGLNVGAMFEMGFQEEFGLKALVGFGKTDFFAGGLFKWMPIPDMDSQPAIGGNIGILYGNESNYSDMTIRVEPLVSKKLTIEETVVTPYVSLPVGIRIRDTSDYYVNDDTKMTFGLVIGSQLQVPRWKNLQFIAEVGLDLDQSPGYLSVGALMYFDSENGFSLE